MAKLSYKLGWRVHPEMTALDASGAKVRKVLLSEKNMNDFFLEREQNVS